MPDEKLSKRDARTYTVWGGFVNGRLAWQTVDDGWGGAHQRRIPALFKHRVDARAQYQDVRKVTIMEADGD